MSRPSPSTVLMRPCRAARERGHVNEYDVPRLRAALFGRHERSGRPLGSEGFVTRVERLLGRVLRPHKRGPKGPWKHNRRRRNRV